MATQAKGKPDEFSMFTGPSLKKIAEELNEVADVKGARMEVRGKGDHMTVRFVAEGYNGDPINQSTGCPGRPGCP